MMKTNRSSVLALALFAAALIVTFLVYRPGLSGPLLLDDFPQLEGLIKESATEPAILFRNYIISTSGPTGRPVAMATFIASAIGHGPDIWWWKYGNLLFHLINGLLVFWLTAMLFKASPQKISLNPWIPAAIVAGLWLLHPLQVSTVLYTVQRMTQLSTLFVLAGLISYVKGRLIQRKTGGFGWLLIGLGFLVFYPLGILSKENAFIFPIFCSLIELLLLRFRGSESTGRQLRILHGILLVGYLVTGVLVLANFSSIVLGRYEILDFTPTERVLTQFRIVVLYLGMLLVPIQRNMGFFHDDIAVSTSLLDPITTLLSAIFLSALIVAATLTRRKLPLFSLGILFYFISHVIESSVLGLELMFEHRNYLGSIGILIAVLSLGQALIAYRRSLGALAMIFLVGFALLTWQRSITWSVPIYMLEYMYRIHPHSPRLNLVGAELSASLQDFKSARGFLDNLNPGVAVELHRLYLDCLENKSVTNEALLSILDVDTGVLDTHMTSSAEWLVQEVIEGRCDVPRKRLLDVLDHMLGLRSRSNTERMSVLFTKAELLASMGHTNAAVEHYMEAQKLTNIDAVSLYKASATLVRAGRLDAAGNMLNRAQKFEKSKRIKLKEVAKRLYLALGEGYEKKRRMNDALAIYEEAITSMPTETQFYLSAAQVLLYLQRYKEAEKKLEEIQTRGLTDRGRYDYEMRRIVAELENRATRDDQF
jgi:hypothetical protein